MSRPALLHGYGVGHFIEVVKVLIVKGLIQLGPGLIFAAIVAFVTIFCLVKQNGFSIGEAAYAPEGNEFGQIMSVVAMTRGPSSALRASRTPRAALVQVEEGDPDSSGLFGGVRGHLQDRQQLTR